MPPTPQQQPTVESLVTHWIERVSVHEEDPRGAAQEIIAEAPEDLRDALERELTGFLELSQGLPANGIQGSEQLGSYELLEHLGTGATGQVWKARNADGTVVALKVIHAHYTMAEEGLQRLTIEVAAANRVVHPALVPVLETEQVGQQQLLVMPLVGDGTTLADELILARERSRKESTLRTLQRLCEVCEGLGALHEHGVLHLDLKPANLLVDQDDRLRITDLGLARLLDDPGLTRTFQVLGTPAYMSPELARGNRKGATPRSDVWAMGVILTEALSLARPFDGATSARVLNAVLEAEPAHLPRRIPGLSAAASTACAEVIARCLEKDPRRRYAHGGELASELKRVLAGDKILGRSPTLRLLGWGRRRKTMLVATTLGLGIIALTTGLAWRESRLVDKAQRSLGLTTRLVSSVQAGSVSIGTQELADMAGDLRELTGDPSLGSASQRAATLVAVGALFTEHDDRRELGVELLTDALEIIPPGKDVQTALVHNALAGAMRDAGSSIRELGHLERVITLLEHNPDPQFALLRARAVVWGFVANEMINKFDYAELFREPEARSLLFASLPENEKDDTPEQRRDRFLLSRADSNWVGGSEELIPFNERCVEFFETKLGADHLWSIEALLMLGSCQYRSGLHDESFASYSLAKQKSERALGPLHPVTFGARLGMAQELLHQGLAAEAVPEYRAAIEGLSTLWGGHNSLTLRISVGLGSALSSLKKYTEILELVEELLPELTENFGPSAGPTLLMQRLEIQSNRELHNAEATWQAMRDQWAGYSALLLELRTYAPNDLAQAVAFGTTFDLTPIIAETIRSWLNQIRTSTEEKPFVGVNELTLPAELDRLESLLDSYLRADEGDVEALLSLMPEPAERDHIQWYLLLRAQRTAEDLVGARGTLEVISATDLQDPLWFSLEKALLEKAEGNPDGLEALAKEGEGWVALRASDLLGE